MPERERLESFGSAADNDGDMDKSVDEDNGPSDVVAIDNLRTRIWGFGYFILFNEDQEF